MGRSALVTGAASGIGKALVQQLVSQGYTGLTVLDLDGDALMKQRQQLQQHAPGVDVLVVAADVCNRAAMERAVSEHVSRFGSMHMALLCAGIGERGDFLNPDHSTESLEKTLDIDLTAVITCTRVIAQAMITAGQGGRIISIASAAGIFPVSVVPYYAAAKGGLVHFTRSLAPRLAPFGIQLATVCPQYVDTPLVRTMLQHQPKVAQEMMGPLYGQPLLQPQQVVDLAVKVMQQPLPQKGAKVPFRQAYAGAGCVWLLLQDGRSLDPFAANPSHKALAAARVASISPGSSSSSTGRGSSSSKMRPQPPKNQLAAASAASMARFGSEAALAAFAQQQLPQSYQKLQVARLTPKFREAVETVTVRMPAVPGDVPVGQVLVRRLFVGINASDVNYTSGRYHGSTAAAKAALPYDAGFESVGVVVAAAPDVSAECPPGSAVATMESGFCEFTLVAARRVLPVPCPAPEVVALLTSGLTASLALEEVGGLLLPGAAAGGSSGSNAHQQQQQQGSKVKQTTVLVTAAAGGTGQFAVQLAKLAGCHVVATCGGADKAKLLQELGVDRVINYKEESVKEVLKREYPQGIDVIYESVGGDMFAICVDALASKGKLIIIGMMSQYSSGWAPSSYPGLTEKLLWKSASVSGFFLLRFAHLWRSHLQRLCQLVSEGQLAVVLDPHRFAGLSAVPDAVDLLQSGASSGKVVVQLSSSLPETQAGAKL